MASEMHIPNEGDKYVQLPSGLLVEREKGLFDMSWYKQQSELEKQGKSMITPMQFVEFLRHIRDNDEELYDKITQKRFPARLENLDAFFEERDDGVYMLTENRRREEPLDKDTLTEYARISLDDYLNRAHTPQGLPTKDVERGDLLYISPRDSSIGRFGASPVMAGFGCDRVPRECHLEIGVRGVLKSE